MYTHNEGEALKPEDWILKYNPSKFKRTYGIMICFNNPLRKSFLRYEMEVKCMVEKYGNYNLIEINRSNVHINNKIPDMIADELAYKCGCVLYPMVLLIDNNGNLVGVKNQNEMIERWNRIYEELKIQYQGDIAQRYLERIGRQITSSYHLNKAIKQNIFIAFYFHKIYTVYQLGLIPNENTIYIPVVPYREPIKYKGTCKLSKRYTNYGTVSVKQTGSVCDDRSVVDLLAKRDIPMSKYTEPEVTKLSALGQLTLQYELDRGTAFIQSIIAECDVRMKDHFEQTMVFEAYHLEDRD